MLAEIPILTPTQLAKADKSELIYTSLSKLAQLPENEIPIRGLILQAIVMLHEGLNIRPDRQMSQKQMDMAVGVIIRQHSSLSPASLPGFVDAFLGGKYGPAYEGLDINKICVAIEKHQEACREARMALSNRLVL